MLRTVPSRAQPSHLRSRNPPLPPLPARTPPWRTAPCPRVSRRAQCECPRCPDPWPRRCRTPSAPSWRPMCWSALGACSGHQRGQDPGARPSKTRQAPSTPSFLSGARPILMRAAALSRASRTASLYDSHALAAQPSPPAASSIPIRTSLPDGSHHLPPPAHHAPYCTRLPPHGCTDALK